MNYLSYNLDWIRVYNSPFKVIIPKLYIGKVAIGTPYFFPRVWVKGNHNLIHEGVLRRIKETKSFNERNQEYKRKEKSYYELYEEMKTYSFAVPKKIGFDFVSLGWKTKWETDDYRHEWNPMWSFVFFKWQIALIFKPKHDMHYWECWLYYDRETKHIAKSTKGRLLIAKKQFPCIWTSTKDGVETKTNYWDLVLKKKYL
jgi:hypothetical protein